MNPNQTDLNPAPTDLDEQEAAALRKLGEIRAKKSAMPIDDHRTRMAAELKAFRVAHGVEEPSGSAALLDASGAWALASKAGITPDQIFLAVDVDPSLWPVFHLDVGRARPGVSRADVLSAVIRVQEITGPGPLVEADLLEGGFKTVTFIANTLKKRGLSLLDARRLATPEEDLALTGQKGIREGDVEILTAALVARSRA